MVLSFVVLVSFMTIAVVIFGDELSFSFQFSKVSLIGLLFLVGGTAFLALMLSRMGKSYRDRIHLVISSLVLVVLLVLIVLGTDSFSGQMWIGRIAFAFVAVLLWWLVNKYSPKR